MKQRPATSSVEPRSLLRARIRATTALPRPGAAGPLAWSAERDSEIIANRKLMQHIAHLERCVSRACANGVMALVAAIRARDPYTEQHSVKVAVYADQLARRAGLPAAQVDAIVIAALLHDVGKIAIPDSILKKEGSLSAAEYERIKEHPAHGVAVLQPLAFLKDVMPLVLHHHEWHNGKGYPHGLAGDAIPTGARFVQMADCIDAMLSPRSYKQARTISATICELQRCRGEQFSPELTDLAVEWLRSRRPSDVSIC